MITPFYVLGAVDLRRVISARIELVFDDGTCAELPALHADTSTGPAPPARTVAPRIARRRGPPLPRLSRIYHRSRKGKR